MQIFISTLSIIFGLGPAQLMGAGLGPASGLARSK